MNKKIQQYGVAVFTTMAAVGTAVIMPNEASRQKGGTFSLKVLYRNEAVQSASLTLTNLNSKERENLRTDAFGFARRHSSKNGFEGDRFHERPAGSYAVAVNKEGVPPKKVRFFLEKDGFTEKVIIIKDPRQERQVEETTQTDAFWEEKAPLPISKINTSSNSYKQRIFLFGGWRKRYLNSVEIYSPGKDRWKTGTPLQFARDHHSSSLVGKRIYVIAGHNQANESGLTATEIYNPAKDTWSLGKPIPTKRYDHSSSTVKREIFVFGGRRAPDSVEIYNTQTDTWRTGPEMPTKRYSHSSHVINKRVYLIGGKYGKTILDTVEEYDPLRNRWTRKAPMPTPRYSHAGCVIDGKIYIFGGKGARSSVEVYDPRSNLWTQEADMPTERYNSTCSASGDKAYLLAGSGGWSKNEMFSPRSITY